MISTFVSNSVEDTIQYARQLAGSFVGGETLLLSGELGAGKTHFVKGVALALGIEDTITSPTFTLHNMYNGELTLHHFDFYRIDDSEEVVLLGLNEYFVTNGVCVIEWHSKIRELLPHNAIHITIDKTGDNSRTIIIDR